MAFKWRFVLCYLQLSSANDRLAQLVERSPTDRKVVSSIPAIVYLIKLVVNILLICTVCELGNVLGVLHSTFCT